MSRGFAYQRTFPTRGNALRARSTCAAVAAIMCASLGFAAEPQPRVHLPGPPIQDLMLGTWTIRVTHEPNAAHPKSWITTGREVWRLGPGGQSLIEEYDEADPAGAVHEFGVAWWQGNSLVQTVETDNSGKHVVHQEIFTDITRTSFTQILKEGPSRAALKTTTIHATRDK